jgi:hypothetical protein
LRIFSPLPAFLAFRGKKHPCPVPGKVLEDLGEVIAEKETAESRSWFLLVDIVKEFHALTETETLSVFYSSIADPQEYIFMFPPASYSLAVHPYEFHVMHTTLSLPGIILRFTALCVGFPLTWPGH